jgi:cobalt/nickel transport system permease protein
VRLSPTPMHIPDGFLSIAVALALWLATAALLATTILRTRRRLGERTVPLMGVLAAFLFAAQAINFPVAGGTSGHLLGAALSSILIGPWPSVLVLTAVVAVQGLLFQDGGLLAMGGNILNMAILGSLVAAAAYRAAVRLAGGNRAGRLASAFVAGWLSVVVGAVAVAIELAVSGVSTITLVLPAMAGVHMIIGLGEGLITAGALAFLETVRPDIVGSRDAEHGVGSAALIAGGLLLALVVALFSPLASPFPDGLARVASHLGFATTAKPSWLAVLGGYTLPFVRNPAIATLLAVMLGTLVAFVVAIAVGRMAAKNAPTKNGASRI